MDHLAIYGMGPATGVSGSLNVAMVGGAGDVVG